ncbi:MAG: M23 family metallopeptidase [Deltaproteobacteria bacterium]|nr:M23 family metallopeptidase [Deltaproteobacteria bacterium]
MSLTSPPSRRPFPLVAVAVVGGLVALGAGGVALWAGRQTGGVPSITLDVPEAVGPRGALKVTVDEPMRGIVDVTVEVSGAGLAPRVLTEVHRPPPASAFSPPGEAQVELSAACGKDALPGLQEGTLTVRVTATRVGTWLSQPEPVVVERAVAVRLTPPTVAAQSSFVHVAQGGAEVVVYEVSAGSVFDGVLVERPTTDAGPVAPWVFPGAPLPGGPTTRRFAFFVVPYDEEGAEDVVKARVRVFAEDALGNRATAGGVVHKAFARPMGKDTIELKDPFLAKVTAETYAQTPDLPKKGAPLDDYLQLNRELRRRNNDFLVELAKQSQPRFLWTKVFVPFDNAAIKGAFADRRTYRRNGAVVDTQDHLGFDLARVERSPVGAGNDGAVLFAGYLGIYGNCVVLDHGFGVMTLYAHLSGIDVKVGDSVVRGAVLGRTGATGLAGGDHLHFTTLVHGRPTNPIEWWDAHWIADRVKLKLGDAFAYDDEGDAEGPRRGRGKRRRR